jgi:hypothetical protein
MQSLGISTSSTISFINSRTGEEEKENANHFRHDIWMWMEQSLARGTFKWIVRTINPIYDIHLLYNKVVSLANKATWISTP